MRQRVQEDFQEEFEEVGNKKKSAVNLNADSDSDDAIPKSLQINIAASQKYPSQQILQALDLIPDDKLTVIVKQNVENIQNLFAAKSGSQKSHWKVPKQYYITCLDVQGDEDVWDESSLADTFEDGRQVAISCPAFIFVPGRVMIALAMAGDQDIEEPCPHVTLLTNDLRERSQIAKLVRLACTRNGPFTSPYNTLKTGGKLKDDKRYITAGVNLDRNKPPITCHFIALPQAMELTGITYTVY